MIKIKCVWKNFNEHINCFLAECEWVPEILTSVYGLKLISAFEMFEKMKDLICKWMTIWLNKSESMNYFWNSLKKIWIVFCKLQLENILFIYVAMSISWYI